MEFYKPNIHQKNAFMAQYCQNDRARDTIVDTFEISIESYEQLLPGQVVLSYGTGNREIHTAFVIFNVDDIENKIRYQPVFSEKIGRRLAKKAGLKLPRKISVLSSTGTSHGSGTNGTSIPRSEDNHQLLLLIRFARAMMLLHEKEPKPMYDPFRRIYKYLDSHPRCKVFPKEIKAINTAIQGHLHSHENRQNERFNNLQDFIAYLHENYPNSHFKKATFDVLRNIFLDHYPNETLYF